jgi:hypothetical protein
MDTYVDPACAAGIAANTAALAAEANKVVFKRIAISPQNRL